MKNHKINFTAARPWIPMLSLSSLIFVSCVEIHNFLPPGGQVGSEVEIIGKGFSKEISENKVAFGGRSAEILYASEEMLRVVVPAGVVRSRIKVSRGRFNRSTSHTDFILLPDHLQHRKFHSPVLGITQGYWIMYPPSYGVAGNRFPIVYTLHGYNGNFGEIFEGIELPGFWQKMSIN